MSGSLLLPRGVGTQMTTASVPAAPSNSVEAVKSPAPTSGAREAVGTSTRYDSPRFSRATRSRSRSTPRTASPALASSTARLSPTYPRPMMHTRALPLSNFS